jgi:hypothetical protein
MHACEELGTRAQAVLQATPFHKWLSPGGDLWANFLRTTDGYLIRFPEIADFEVSHDGTKVGVWRTPGIETPTIDHVFQNQVLPLALSRQGELVLHGAAIEAGDAAIAFVGPSGRGKSTLTASYGVSGHRFLSDDGLRLRLHAGGANVLPNHPSVRLWADSESIVMGRTKSEPVGYSNKARFLADSELRFCPDPLPLGALYFLGNAVVDEPTIQRLEGAAVIIELIKNSFLLDVEAQDMLQRHFDLLSTFAAARRFYSLDYPRSYDALPAVRLAVLEHSPETT